MFRIVTTRVFVQWLKQTSKRENHIDCDGKFRIGAAHGGVSERKLY